MMKDYEKSNSEKPEIDLIRTRFILLTLFLVLVWNFTSSLLGLGWITAAIISFGLVILNTIHIRNQRDHLLCRIFILGLVAGWIELLADRWLVNATGTLVYLPGGPFIVRSPAYMPFAWGVVLTQLGFIGWWLSQRIGMTRSSLMVGLIAGINIPLYEQWARNAGWWYYRNTSMLGHTPWYIILGEFIIALPLPLMVTMIEKRHHAFSIAAGIILGLWIWLSYVLAFHLLGT